MAQVGILGQTGGGASYVPGADVTVSHSAGTDGMTDHGVVSMTDGDYRLLEIKQSGILTFDTDQITQGILADICLVGAGGGGDGGTYTSGGGGGFMYNYYKEFLEDLTVIIGAGGTGGVSGTESHLGAFGGISSFKKENNSAAVATPQKLYVSYYTSRLGTGGGGSGSTQGYGDGLNKYPFGDSAHFQIHCGGGGAGGINSYYGTDSNGAPGGTNGSDGGSSTTGGYNGGAAGDSSAGAGGSGGGSGFNASYYGGGGGGSGVQYDQEVGSGGYGGNGYQGVIWIRIPA